MGEDRFSQWAKFQAAWHRPDPDRSHRTMCSMTLPDSVEIASTATAAADVAANRTTVCGICERLVEQARGVEAPTPRAPERERTPEQQKIRDYLDRERRQRAIARRNAELEKPSSGGQSVRTVSGGLPTLGKKR